MIMLSSLDDGRILEVNDGFEIVTGYRGDEVRGRAGGALGIWGEGVQHAELVERLRRDGRIESVECEIRDKRSERHTVLLSGELLEALDRPLVLWQGVDISERKRNEDELERYRSELEEIVVERTRSLEESTQKLAQSQRHAAVGTLAAGIAHEINNPLGAILAATQYAMVCDGDDDERDVWRRSLETIEEEATRGGRVVRSVLQFSRGEHGERWRVDLREVISGALTATKRYSDERRSRVAYEEGTEPLLVDASPIEIGQVVVALVNNALESRDEGVNVRIESGHSEASVWFRVSDDGGGIPEESRSKLFDPFFTTRLGRGGTGLGLSVVHGIVEAHEGRISVDSELGQGTVVRVDLPA